MKNIGVKRLRRLDLPKTAAIDLLGDHAVVSGVLDGVAHLGSRNRRAIAHAVEKNIVYLLFGD